MKQTHIGGYSPKHLVNTLQKTPGHKNPGKTEKCPGLGHSKEATRVMQNGVLVGILEKKKDVSGKNWEIWTKAHTSVRLLYPLVSNF